jgi:hypothetical protein
VNPYAYALGAPVDFSDPSGAWAIETALIDEAAVQKSTAADRLIGCGLALIGSIVEISINIATKTLATSDNLQLAIGAVASCALGAASGLLTAGGQVFAVPIAAALVAGISDLAAQWICASRTGVWTNFNPMHALYVGLAVFSIGVFAGIAGNILPAPTASVAAFFAGLLIAFGSGGASSYFDVNNQGGTSC